MFEGNERIVELNMVKPYSTYSRTIFDSKICLDGDWDFYFYEGENFSYDNIPCKFTNTIKVPKSIEIAGFGRRKYVSPQYPWEGIEEIRAPEVPSNNQIGVYKKVINVSKDNDLYFLRFDGVESAIELYVNDEFVGYSEDSFTPSEFEISKYVTEGENKIIAVVYKYSTGSWFEDQDFWRLFGIHRSVWLLKKPVCHIHDIKVTRDFNEDLSKVKLGISCDINEANYTHIVKELISPCGKIRSGDDVDIIDNPLLWSTDYPNLYKLKVSLYNSQDEIDKIELMIGFNKVAIKNNILYHNNKRIVIKGINRHDFSRHGGRAITKKELEWDVKFMKEHNINAVRTSHYPNDEYFYELCNKFGILVMDEVNLETHGTWWIVKEGEGFIPNVTIPGNREFAKEIVLARARNMYERDKNNPCIFSWSLGNEAHVGSNFWHMREYFKENDKERYVHYEGVNGHEDYFGVTDFNSKMYAFPEHIVEELESGVSKPYILCEYEHSMGNSGGSIDKYMALTEKYPQYTGGFIWEMFEHTFIKNDMVAYGGDFDDRSSECNFIVDGIVSGDRIPNVQAKNLKRAYQPLKITYGNNKVMIKNNYDEYNICNDHRLIITAGKNTTSLNVVVDKLISIDNGKTLIVDLEEYSIINVEVHHLNPHFKNNSFDVATQSFVKHQEIIKTSGQYGQAIVTRGDENITIKGVGFNHLFSLKYKSVLSITYNGHEYVNRPKDSMKMNFWRALTENDRAADKEKNNVKWKNMSYMHHNQYEVRDVNIFSDSFNVTIGIKGELPSLTFHFNNDGSLKMELNFKGYANLNNEEKYLSCIGIRLPLKKEMKYVRYNGYGPYENYCDRKFGMLYNEYEFNIYDQDKYVVPQEYGNRTGVSSLEIYDDNGEGLLFQAVNKPLEFSFIPETDMLLESMYYDHHVESMVSNQLKIHGKMEGVGGYDTWGALPAIEHRILGTNDYKLEFVISKL